MTDQSTATTAPDTTVDWNGQQFELVRAVFDSSSAGSTDSLLLERVRAEFPGRGDDLHAGVGVLRDLLRIEQRPERFRRVLRVWTSRIANAIRRGDFHAAGTWMRAVTESPVFPNDFAIYVVEAVRELSREELLEELVVKLAKAGDPPAAAPLLMAWGEPLVEYLVGGMATDSPPVNRRHLVEYLGMAGRADVRLLTPHLRDPRWFIVRNLASAIGRTGRETAVPALEGVLEHPDDRVRVEVIRALTVLGGEDGIAPALRALGDESPRVRQAAVSLLRASPSDSVVDGVASVLESGSHSADDARRLVDVIAERRSPAARTALERLAGKRSGFGSGRTVRDAAKAVLERMR
ncbi:MAG: HEAT repeat domain-containing protein [Acidimicrobiia bacterium]